MVPTAARSVKSRVRGTVVCDPGRVRQLFSNLLANALHHGTPDHPVTAAASRSDDDLVISVANRGPPIPADAIPRLFNPYTRASPGRSGAAGLGLGLYIVAQIAAAHQGTVHASSNDADTTFTVRLPQAPRPARVDS